MEKRTLIYIAIDSACYFFFIVVVVMSEWSLRNMPFMCIMRGTRIIVFQ